MKRSIFVIFVLSLALNSSLALAASLEDVLSRPDEFNGKLVEVEGEAIGETLKDKKGEWINILSQGHNIGIFSSETEVFRSINYWGSYKEGGDWVKIKGVFYKNCSLHQVSDIHLNSLKVTKKGFKKELIVSPQKIKAAIVLFIICLTTALVYLIKIRRK